MRGGSRGDNTKTTIGFRTIVVCSALFVGGFLGFVYGVDYVSAALALRLPFIAPPATSTPLALATDLPDGLPTSAPLALATGLPVALPTGVPTAAAARNTPLPLAAHQPASVAQAPHAQASPCSKVVPVRPLPVAVPIATRPRIAPPTVTPPRFVRPTLAPPRVVRQTVTPPRVTRPLVARPAANPPAVGVTPPPARAAGAPPARPAPQGTPAQSPVLVREGSSSADLLVRASGSGGLLSSSSLDPRASAHASLLVNPASGATPPPEAGTP